MAVKLALSRSIIIGGKCATTKSFLLPSNSIKSQYRTGYVLRRRVPIPIAPQHHTMDYIMRTLDPLYEEYEIVENTDEKPIPNVEVILKNYVEDVGEPGQRVFLEPMQAYNLIILGQAVYVTPENISKMKILAESEIEKHSSLSAFKTMNQLKKRTLSVYMNMHEPWTIEPWHIRVNYRIAGVHILSDDCIELPEKPINGPNLDLEGKDFVTFITINNCERVPVRCRLRHYTKIFNQKIILPPDHECQPSDPIIPEQAELLASIPLPEYKPPTTVSRGGKNKMGGKK